MNVPTMNVSAAAATEALKTYKAHRATYDKRDWEIERILRAIARGKKVISVNDAIRSGGIDAHGMPHLAIMRADQQVCLCQAGYRDKVVFTNQARARAAEWHFEIAWPNRVKTSNWDWATANLPRIPPQHRPAAGTLSKYHLLWEAEWTPIPPRDPMLLKRIGKDAWVVLAAWDLTDVEINVLRAHAPV